MYPPRMGAGEMEAVAAAWRALCSAFVILQLMGFLLLEAGNVRTAHVASVLVKNVAGGATTILTFVVVGQLLVQAMRGKSEGLSNVMVSACFCNTANTITSGAIAERAVIEAYLAFCVVFSALMYPLALSACTGEDPWIRRLLQESRNFPTLIDNAGGCYVHVLGGTAAATLAYFVGPRLGASKSGKPRFYGHSATAICTGTLLMYFTWFGFNGVSAVTSDDGAERLRLDAVERTFMNTLLGGAAGVPGSELFNVLTSRRLKFEPSVLCNGAISGLVAVTAGCNTLSPLESAFVGASGSFLATTANHCLHRFTLLDDPVGAAGVHAFAGAWGAMMCGLAGRAASAHQFCVQVIGVLVCVLIGWGCTALFAIVVRALGWSLRVSAHDELNGTDSRFDFMKSLGTENAPEGVISIVVTDIANSSTFWGRCPAEMEVATGLHDTLMRNAIARHNGYEVATEGDAFCIAFNRALDAVCFCVDVQRELAATDWPPKLFENAEARVQGLNVRMAIDTSWCPRSLHSTLGTFHYRGKAVRTAYAMVDAISSSMGIVVTTHRVHRRIMSYSKAIKDSTIVHLGVFELAHATEKLPLFAIVPNEQQNIFSAISMRKATLVSPGFLDAPGVNRNIKNSGGDFALVLSPSERVVIAFVSVIELPEKDLPTALPHCTSYEALDRIDSVESLSNDENPSASGATLSHLPVPGTPGAPTEDSTFNTSREEKRNTPLRFAKTISQHSRRLLGRHRVKEAHDPNHDVIDIIRGTLELFQGYECQEHQGKFMIAFPSAHDAIGWATACHVSLKAHVTDGDSRNRVAVGMHCDVPSKIMPHESSGRADYFGDVVNVAARVCSLSSDATYESESNSCTITGDFRNDLTSESSAGIALRTLGGHRLRNIQRSHDLFAVDPVSESLYDLFPSALADKIDVQLREYTGRALAGRMSRGSFEDEMSDDEHDSGNDPSLLDHPVIRSL